MERFSEAQVAKALESVERDEIAGLADPKVSLGGNYGVQMYRNARFMAGVTPIVRRYLVVKRRIARVRRKVKHVDREGYYDERTAMWDDEHEKAAKDIRKLFNKMGGLYNKLAQDWATRDGLLPQAWVDELKDSFEAMPERPWSVMKKEILLSLKEEDVTPIAPTKQGLERYFARVDEDALAAASIGQVHLATTHGGDRVVVKAIYPEIRRFLMADLINARRAAQQITTLLRLPVKGTDAGVELSRLG